MEECKRDRGELDADRGELDADRGELAPPARVMSRAALREAAAQVSAGATTWAELGRELGIHARTLRDRAVAAGFYRTERVARWRPTVLRTTHRGLELEIREGAAGAWVWRVRRGRRGVAEGVSGSVDNAKASAIHAADRRTDGAP